VSLLKNSCIRRFARSRDPWVFFASASQGMQHHASPAAGREIDRPRNPPASRSRIFHTLSPSGRTCGIPTSCGPVSARQLADRRRRPARRLSLKSWTTGNGDISL
jgi:hypothetical protein